jgi:hypothetical protein
MSRPVWVAGLLLCALALPVQAAPSPMKEPPAPTASAPTPTIAEATAVQVARTLFPAALVQGEPHVELSPGEYGGVSVWHVSWEGDQSYSHVGVDARDGQVIMADHFEHGAPLPDSSRLTQAEAAAKAEEWLGKLAAGFKPSLVPMKPEPGWYDPAAFMFNYEWQVSGYKVPGSGAHLRIDAATGELRSWHLSRPQGKMVMPLALLAESEARSAFAKLPLDLIYTRANWSDFRPMKRPAEPESEKLLLAYRPTLGLVLSQSGSWIGPDGQPVGDVSIPTWKQVPPPTMPYKPPAEPLSKAASLALAQAVTGLTREPDQVSVDRWDGHVTFSFGWVDWEHEGEGKGSSSAHVQVDATRGLIREVWSTPPLTDEPPSLTTAEAQQAAVSFIQTYRPDLAGAIYNPSGVANYGGGFVFQFDRQHEGIPVEGHGVTLRLDPHTGKVIELWGDSVEPAFTLPEPKGVLAPGPLMAKLVEVAGIELGWVQVRPAGEEPHYQLVWHLGQNVPVMLIEAQTGIFRDHDGTDVLKFRLPPSDVAGHWAEREIQALFAQRIVTVEAGQFMPEQPMTTAEAAAWLERLNYGGMHPFYMTEGDLGSKEGIAPGEPNPSAPITREAFVRQVVVALGYERIANMPNQIGMSFVDQAQIEPGARNAVAVLNGLGVIRGTPEGYFLPKKSLTRAEAARILFQSLEHRRYGYYK